MSKVNKLKQEEPTMEMPEMTTQNITADDSQAGSTHARRVVLQWNGSAEELKHGAILNIKNAMDVFQPQYDMSKVEEDQKASLEKLDFSKGIVTGMKLKSIFSNVDDSVTVGVKLYDNQPNIVNKDGFLYTPKLTDMGEAHSSEDEGFINLVSVLPFEKGRPDVSIYTPENLLNNRFIEQYGGYTMDKLWEGIVPFPKQDFFYVESSHIILKVIKNNWEMLGVPIDQEKQKEGEYIKVGKSVVNNVIKQLYEQVICQIPYTSFDSFQARFQANAPSTGENYKIVAEVLVEYKYPAISPEEHD
tara:strand:- start:2236 stop:3141 length:906 start_codon:yes stop_codon:yes gene_type:complete